MPKRNVDMTITEDTVKIVSADQTNDQTTEATEAGAGEAKATKQPKAARERSVKYKATRAQVDKTKLYDSFAAVELIKKLSYSKFPGTVTAHVSSNRSRHHRLRHLNHRASLHAKIG
jgi:hypothetical protein